MKCTQSNIQEKKCAGQKKNTKTFFFKAKMEFGDRESIVKCLLGTPEKTACSYLSSLSSITNDKNEMTFF